MARPISRPLQVLVLSVTALSLLGHGVSGPPACLWKDGESYEYNVIGTCGDPGVIQVKRSDSSCSVEVTGDDVGLPRSGNLTSTLASGFDLYGSLNEDWDYSCNVAQSVDGVQKLSCYRTQAWPPHSRTPWCEATLIPRGAECDLGDCEVPSCAGGEHLVVGDDGCCPACIADAAATVLPTELPDLCDNDTCISQCPSGQELVRSSQSCCPICVTQPAACVEGRAKFREAVVAELGTARSCQADRDCSIFAAGSRCGGACPTVMSLAGFTALQERVQPPAEAWCATCQGYDDPTPCPAIGGPSRCDNGNCVLDCSYGACVK